MPQPWQQASTSCREEAASLHRHRNLPCCKAFLVRRKVSLWPHDVTSLTDRLQPLRMWRSRCQCGDELLFRTLELKVGNRCFLSCQDQEFPARYVAYVVVERSVPSRPQ